MELIIVGSLWIIIFLLAQINYKLGDIRAYYDRGKDQHRT